MRCSRLLPVLALMFVSAASSAQDASKPAKDGSSKEAKPKKDKSQPVSPEEIEGSKRRTERAWRWRGAGCIGRSCHA